MKYVSQTLKNPTKKDLSFRWDGVEYIVPAEGEKILPDFIAAHGAKKLADINCKDSLDVVGRKEFMGSLIAAAEQVIEKKEPTLKEKIDEVNAVVEEAKEFENKDNLPWCDSCDSKGVRHKKECPKFK